MCGSISGSQVREHRDALGVGKHQLPEGDSHHGLQGLCLYQALDLQAEEQRSNKGLRKEVMRPA
jgi:hypothetical protein